MNVPSMLKKVTLVAALAASVPAFASTADNLLVNGSFENTALSGGSWNIFNALDGWTTGPLGVEIRNGVAGTAQNGSNFVELDTTGNSSIFQNITTTVGQIYNLTFWFAPRSGVSENSNGIDVFWNGSKIAGASGDANYSTGWVRLKFDVVGTGSDKLSFVAAGTSDSYGGSLDNVSLTAAVPEPESYAMLLAGLGLMGAVVRRRSRKN